MAELNPAARLYVGKVAHLRHTPFQHRFSYRIWMMAVDLDRLGEVVAASRLFRHNRRGLISLQDRDHGARDGTPLRAYAEAALRAQQLEAFAARIVFVTMPRIFGFAFNPISLYYCYDAAERLGAVLYQVKNTFGGQIGYLIAVQGEAATIRQSAPKRMHVSPFFDMQGGYRFTVTAPAKNLSLCIRYGDEAAPRMTAAMTLKARPWSDASLLRLMLQMPLTPMKVMGAIHWQALKLWLRGAKFHKMTPATHDAVVAGDVE